MVEEHHELFAALSEDEQRELEQAALAAELTSDEVERAAGLLADGIAVDEAVDVVLAERAATDEPPEPTGLEEEEAPTPEQMERIFAALEKQAAKHREKVMELAGPLLADLAPCPLCQEQAPGFYLHTIPPDQAQERIQAVTAILSGGIVPEYMESKQVERCEDCNGWGRVLSGARAPEHATVPCGSCQGTGHKPKLTPPAQPVLPEAPAQPQPGNGAGVGAAGLADPWGRPVGHPHYNIHPALVSV